VLQTPGNNAGIAGVKRPHEEAGGDLSEDDDFLYALACKRVQKRDKKSKGIHIISRIYFNQMYSALGWRFENSEEEREFENRMREETDWLKASWEEDARVLARRCFFHEKKVYDAIVSKRTGGDEVVLI
jgi:hypothetical protein